MAAWEKLDIAALSDAQPGHDPFGQRQSCGQPRAFDAQQMDQPANPMAVRPVYAKIGIGFTRADNLWTNAGVIGHQGDIGHAGPPMADHEADGGWNGRGEG